MSGIDQSSLMALLGGGDAATAAGSGKLLGQAAQSGAGTFGQQAALQTGMGLLNQKPQQAPMMQKPQGSQFNQAGDLLAQFQGSQAGGLDPRLIALLQGVGR